VASATRSCTPGGGDEVLLDLLASPLRSRPWSTKTHVSWSRPRAAPAPAATAESTPPDSPQTTRLSPTVARIAATCSSITPVMVQEGEQPAIS
jgi:hypothetical protein